MKKETVIIVGAGAAGIGCGILLKLLNFKNFVVVERHEVGASFSRWPEQMRFISPSFPSNGFGLLDLNSIAPETSPGYSLKTEHPTGEAYAAFLQAAAKHFKVPVKTGVSVSSLEPIPENAGFILTTSKGVLKSRFVIWAAGEFQYPYLNPFPGAEHCIHNSTVSSWKNFPGEEYIIIGGYESGIDAAVALSALGKRVTVIDKKDIFRSENSDPSCNLSPFTIDRLKHALEAGNIEIIGGTAVSRVQRNGDSYIIRNRKKTIKHSKNPPILATGFKGSPSLISNLFEWHGNYPVLTENDESTITPGLFLSGPNVRHGDLNFCFIYKFRQRFAVIAKAIVERLGVIDTSALGFYREKGMFLDDLSCCGEDCKC